MPTASAVRSSQATPARHRGQLGAFGQPCAALKVTVKKGASFSAFEALSYLGGKWPWKPLNQTAHPQIPRTKRFSYFSHFLVTVPPVRRSRDNQSSATNRTRPDFVGIGRFSKMRERRLLGLDLRRRFTARRQVCSVRSRLQPTGMLQVCTIKPTFGSAIHIMAHRPEQLPPRALSNVV